MRINHITGKNYNVITTFDRRSRYEFPQTWKPGQKEDNYFPLPNAPMVAKHTLLAEMLRNGSYVTGRRERDLDNQGPHRLYATNADALKGKLLGIEIEYYPKSGDATYSNRLTEIGGDGSLDSGGSELRRLTWTSKSGRLEGLLSLKLKGTINKRCGLHVHVDARHLTEEKGLLNAKETYERLIMLYPMLKKLVPKSRMRNRFCAWKNSIESHDRYCAINFQSFKTHGTIEFRCQGGTVNLVKIESWALLCQFLVNYCANPLNTPPSNWNGFIAILPEPLRSWCILRKEKLYGNSPMLNERTMSAVLE